MSMKKWQVLSYDKDLAKALSAECEIDPIVALIASARGYADSFELEQFISDEPVFSDPFKMADIKIAADIINAALEDGKKIAVFGDYDCDGVTATSLLCSYLRERKGNCIFYIPDRFSEGYGMNTDAVRHLKEQGVELIITVDNGIVCFEEVKLAKELGMDIIVTDHHLPLNTLPEADAVVNPHRSDCPSEFKEICGAEVAFRLVCVLENKEPEELLEKYADLLCVAVLADIMPLTLENRSIVKYGVKKLKSNARAGFNALLNVSGVEIGSVDATKIAFSVCPRINAAGRMGSAARAVDLLLCDNMLNALKLADEIDNENSNRQRIEKEIFEQAVKIIEENRYNYDRVIVASGENWHHGVIGIVAARIAEKYGVPCVLLSVDGETASGSGRSIEGFSLYNAIADSKHLMLKFGGHSQAAGITINTCDIDEFRNRINAYAYNTEYVPPTLHLDCKLNPAALSLDLAYSLKVLEPFGTGNKIPLFGVYGVTLIRITPIGNKKHLRLLFTKGENSFQCLLFGVSPSAFCFEVGDCLDLAVTVDVNTYKGSDNVSVLVKAIRISGVDDERLFGEICAFNDFCAEKQVNTSLILPSREDVGVIYKKICEKPILADRVKYIFLNTLGFSKTSISLITLEELGLISNDNGLYFANPNAPKSNLLNSKTYKLLAERSGNND